MLDPTVNNGHFCPVECSWQLSTWEGFAPSLFLVFICVASFWMFLTEEDLGVLSYITFL
jgi:hypothetical protein